MNDTTQRYRQSINRAKLRIATNWLKPWKLDELADAAHLSPAHFHRVFRRMAGESLGEYLGRVRLDEARRRLIQTDRAIGLIAVQVGYDDVSAFHRAFRRQFGMTPKRLRQLRHVLGFDDFLCLQHGNTRRNTTMAIECEYVERDAITLYTVTRKGMKDNTFAEAARSAFDTLGAWLGSKGLWPSVVESIGFCPQPPQGPNDPNASFAAAVTLKAPAEASGEIAVENMPGGRFARFVHVGPYDTLWQSWNAIRYDWMPANHEIIRMAPCIEVYVNNPHTTPPAELRTDIYVPVKG
jgi:AraC family transcriptional regulator